MSVAVDTQQIYIFKTIMTGKGLVVLAIIVVLVLDHLCSAA